MRKNAGNLMAVFLGILLLVVVILPLVIQLLQSESKQSVKRQKSTVAFQLAEAAVAKGVAKVTETRQNFMDAIAGIPLSDYADDRVYTDVPGGQYKVKITSGSVSGTLCIMGTGMDATSHEIRAIAAEYSGNDPDSPALIFNQAQWGGASWIVPEWGSVKSYGNLQYFKEHSYPRLYSAGSIFGRDLDPSPPNTDNTHYWAYKTDMGSPPVPDLAYYKQKAMSSVVPSSSTTGEIRRSDGSPTVRTPPNSGYFKNVGLATYFDKQSALPEAMGNLYEYRSSTSVIYLDSGSNYYLYRTFLEVEALIILNTHYTMMNSMVPYFVFAATIPATAPYEYQNTVPVWGPTSGQAWWNSTFSGIYSQPNHCCYNIVNPQVRGYVYGGAGGAHGQSKFIGVAQFTAYGSFSSHCKVYYDPTVLENVAWAKAPIHRVSWIEVSRSW